MKYALASSNYLAAIFAEIALAVVPLASLATACTSSPGASPCPTESYTVPFCVATDGGDAAADASGPQSCVAPTSDCMAVCRTGDLNVTACHIVDAGSGSVECTGTTLCHTGRRFTGLRDRPPGTRAGRRDVRGSLFADAAYLEAASVLSFERLARELRAHDAPPRLVRLAESSRRDEVRHAKSMRALAKRYGARAASVERVRHVVRPLDRVLEENAVEGCIRETFGALLATYQAKQAADPEIRAAMARIAKDETRHAALAWKIGAWGERRLDAHGRARVRDARVRALRALEDEVGVSPDAVLVREAGLPTARRARWMLGELARQIGLSTAA